MEFSPTGKQVVPSAGPKNAKIIIIGESPASEEVKQGIPLVGKSGQLLNKALVQAGIDRSQCYIMNCVPVRAPKDKFADHDQRDIDYGRAKFTQELAALTGPVVFLALGANPTEWLLGTKLPVQQYGEGKREGFIGQWRGSVIPIQRTGQSYEDYLSKLSLQPVVSSGFVIPTYHPAAVLRQMSWHPWLLMDVQKAALVATTNTAPSTTKRKWFFNDVKALRRLADSDIDLIAIDSELDPYIVGICTEDEVHVFQWDEGFRGPLTRLLGSPKIMKIAHKWLHDHAFFRKCLDIPVEKPYVDTLGLAFVLNTGLQKELSPHIATRFTNWPYHKWLSNVDQLWYCGMDTVVCYDAYWPQIDELKSKKLFDIAFHDHRLLTPLLDMQAKGFKVNTDTRLEVEKELQAKLDGQEAELTEMITPVVDKKIKFFQKPHLFEKLVQCECCGGGTKQRLHCLRCANIGLFGTDEITREDAVALGFKSMKALKEALPACTRCKATGKVTKRLPFNIDSSDQIADVVYRGLGIRPRKYKGVETVKAAQLDPIKDKHPIIEKIVEISETGSELDTVKRLSPGSDGCLHCEFDPWGTGSGRVASKEGIIEPGTNAQNLPKEARRFVVPREGYTFIYPDMAQVEARAYAVISGDKNLRKALYEVLPDLGKADYHTWLLRALHDYDSRISLSRDQSKRTSYAGFFGARPEQLAKELSAEAFRKGEGMMVDAKQAITILDVLYRICPGIRDAQKNMCEEVRLTRKLRNKYTGREFVWLGYIMDKKDKGELDYEIKKQIYSRQVQDMGAYVLGKGLIDMYYESGEWGKLLTPLIHVHDALLIEVPTNRIDEGSALAQRLLSRYIWDMDFPAEIKRGNNWYAAS